MHDWKRLRTSPQILFKTFVEMSAVINQEMRISDFPIIHVSLWELYAVIATSFLI